MISTLRKPGEDLEMREQTVGKPGHAKADAGEVFQASQVGPPGIANVICIEDKRLELSETPDLGECCICWP